MTDHIVQFDDYCRIVLTFPTISARDEWRANHIHEGEDQ